VIQEKDAVVDPAHKVADGLRDPPLRSEKAAGNNFKWTKTHGFFVQMGGFMAHKTGSPKRVLTADKLLGYYAEGRIDLSGVTEARINDHSKADGFAKGLALLQTCWFIVQCVARFSDRRLVLTELELVTAALAILSLVMYALWWNKPFNAEIPIVLVISDTPYVFETNDFENHSAIGEPSVLDQFVSNFNLYLTISSEESIFVELRDAICQSKYILRRIREFLTDNGAAQTSMQGLDSLKPGAISVPTFFSIATKASHDDLKLRLPCFAIAAVFGIIHCVGWSTKIHFSSRVAALLWRISSGILTGSPLMWSLYFIFVYIFWTSKTDSTSEIIYLALQNVFKYISIFTIPFYIISRIVLIVLAFVEFRDPPPGALANLQWADILPFIH